MFHYKTCGHCQTIEPEYQEAAAILTESDDVVLAWLDTEDYPDIPARYDVTGAPVFKWFAKGTTEAEKFYYVHYNGRMGNTLLRMIGERVTGFTKQLPPEKQYVTKIKGNDFESTVKDASKKVVLCYLYPSWSESDNVKLAMKRVGSAFDGEDSVGLVKMAIETVVERDITETYNFRNYPGFLAFWDGGSKWEEYKGDQDVISIVNYLNSKAGTHREYLGPGVHRPSGIVNKMAHFAESYGSGSNSKEVTPDLVKEAEAVVTTLQGSDVENAKHYVKILKRMLDGGSGYVETELKRLESLLSKSSITPQKKTLFLQRKEILETFRSGSSRISLPEAKDEL